MDRRRFTLAALFSPAFLAGCQSESRFSREPARLHNENVRQSLAEIDQAMNAMEMRVSAFNAENWQDALANLQTSMVRMHADIDELKKALGYSEAA